MKVQKYYPAPRWINVLRNIEKYKFHSSIFIEYPLDYPGQMSLEYFIKWCNHTSKNNSIIFVKIPENIQDIEVLLNSIFATLTYIQPSQNYCIARKMQARYIQTGFPITIKAKCHNSDCTEFTTISTKYLQFINRQKLNKYTSQLFCPMCKRKKSMSCHETDSLADYLSAMMIKNVSNTHTDNSMMID